MSAEFYTGKTVYICVFITCSTSYCLCDIFMVPWKIYMYVCMYIQSGQNCCWGEGMTPAQQRKLCAAHTKRSETRYICELKVVTLQKGLVFRNTTQITNCLILCTQFLQYWIQEFHLYSQIVTNNIRRG